MEEWSSPKKGTSPTSYRSMESAAPRTHQYLSLRMRRMNKSLPLPSSRRHRLCAENCYGLLAELGRTWLME